MPGALVLTASIGAGHDVPAERLANDLRRRGIDAHRPDVIVSTYPGTTELLGRLRRAGRLQIPTAAVITDLASLRMWAHPGIDLHLMTHPESMREVRAIAGRGADIVAVRGFNPA